MAVSRMLRALRGYAILGVQTTIPFLVNVMESTPFEEGETYTHFIETHFADWSPENRESLLAGITYVIDDLARPLRASGTSEMADPPTPWETLGEWRL